MEIRLAKQEDISRLIALLLQVGQVHHELRPDIFPPRTLKYNEEYLTELLDEEVCPVFVAVEDDLVVGYCFCALREYQGSAVVGVRRELYIDDLCVDEKCRRQGIASSLYRHVMNYAKDCGCQAVTLNVWCGNDDAMGFYEKMGMRPRHITMEAFPEEPYAD